jgi:hypothetical protein
MDLIPIDVQISIWPFAAVAILMGAIMALSLVMSARRR